MKNTIKLGLLSAMIIGVFSACSSEPKSVEYYKDPKNAKELEAKIKECQEEFPKGSKKLNEEQVKYMNGNPSKTYLECENAYKAEYSKSLDKPRESAREFFKNNK
ncbi:EexN family lipoprotein [Campylobacter jejuni]|nr:EexN family lipoprotein [Campylobacter jejuni]MBX1185198.1 EexN family lipoprotein [Campylobacter jejuni]MBX1435567.1 EexN family lipoprotein [Campylobacter jejuni]MBX1439187.1 EexN family lipoprotein [Campylobacter jejuni]MBX2557466.1 EexN family lipoprotein [Campylobacter jejuni]